MTYAASTNVNPKFASVGTQLTAITPADNTAIGPHAWLYCGGAGTVALVAERNSSAVTLTVIAGQILPIRFQGVDATGTSATGLVAID